MADVFHALHENGVLLLFVILGIGMIVGQIKIKGIALGAAAVLFVAIGASAWANSYGVTLSIDHLIGRLGLAVFTFAIGIASGPNFVAGFKKSMGPVLSLLVILGVVGTLSYVVGHKLLGMPLALVAGTFAGATTNTPALNAAGVASGAENVATVGYSISYIFGVIGMLFFAGAALSYRRTDTDTPTPVANRTIRIERDDAPKIGDIIEKYGEKVRFSRLRRGETGPVVRPSTDDCLNRDDLVTVVGPSDLVNRVVESLGHGSSHSLIEDRSELDFRRITISDPKLAGLTVAELELPRRFSATISRVRRGDVDMVGEPNLVVQQGDRVRVVAPTSKMKEVTKFFGDSTRGLSDINPIAFGIGMAIGLLIGELPILTPTGETFSIGAAAGTLIVGLLFGYIGRIGPFVTAMPYIACQVLTEFGLLIFLAQAGTKAGSQIAHAFTGGDWWRILLLGIIITTAYGGLIYLVMRFGWRSGGTRLSGILGGAQTQPAILAFANSRTAIDARVALGYAMVYPMAMIGKILVAQILGGL
ncbi:MAG: TrkA C-terminal domain-containing protein [Actinomycetaceae bacterium]|nr:TrkA C-terminal domain-containing protein [Actinomycetaceae bacterium]